MNSTVFYLATLEALKAALNDLLCVLELELLTFKLPPRRCDVAAVLGLGGKSLEMHISLSD